MLVEPPAIESLTEHATDVLHAAIATYEADPSYTERYVTEMERRYDNHRVVVRVEIQRTAP